MCVCVCVCVCKEKKKNFLAVNLLSIIDHNVIIREIYRRRLIEKRQK